MTPLTLQDKLLARELNNLSVRSREYGAMRHGQREYGVTGLYGDLAFIRNLDIVNELGGHTGCVNALR